ncbi:DUF4097 family beta strand repeat-containing protein [Thalassotalea profundi]|uniref:Adhesin domain-containing protein n=1 Tax=Thalassotalea profundi TaxID=2036687 RepID=A0ABQ3IMV6_9GAMM|nr:hypothetical protein [Thalassotalea profundi]GHE86791.1 hypothetical protein GCM10011501_15030 [Thalassotalea profundi]
MLKDLNKMLFMGIILAFLSWGVQADVVDQISKSFDVGNSPRLTLQNINGGVKISAWDKKVIEVNATVTADTQEEREMVSVIIEQTGRRVEIESKYKKSRGYKGNSAEVEYKIMVPSFTVLSSIELVNGSLEIKEVQGEIKAELVNGSFKATGVGADVNISSVNGSVSVAYQDDIEELSQIEIETVNGAVKLYLPKIVGADVSVETMHGSIKNDFGLLVDKHRFIGRSLDGIIGNGKVNIDIETVNGSVKILNN